MPVEGRNGPTVFSPDPSLTLLLDLAVGHLHGGWCLGEGIEHGEAAISQARGGGIHHCMGTRVHHVATHSCGYRRRHDGGGQRHWKTQIHIRELIPIALSHPAPGVQPLGSVDHALRHNFDKRLFLFPSHQLKKSLTFFSEQDARIRFSVPRPLIIAMALSRGPHYSLHFHLLLPLPVLNLHLSSPSLRQSLLQNQRRNLVKVQILTHWV